QVDLIVEPSHVRTLLEVFRTPIGARALENAFVVAGPRRFQMAAQRLEAQLARFGVMLEEGAGGRKGKLPVVELFHYRRRHLLRPREQAEQQLALFLAQADERAAARQAGLVNPQFVTEARMAGGIQAQMAVGAR